MATNRKYIINRLAKQLSTALKQTEVLNRTDVSMKELAEAIAILMTKEYLQREINGEGTYKYLDIMIKDMSYEELVWQTIFKVSKKTYIDRR